jgi:hypothetical protein
MTDKYVDRVAEAVLTDDAATRASLRFLRQRYAQSKCDSEAVADCVRCNVMFLVRRFEDVLSAALTSTDATPDIAKLGDETKPSDFPPGFSKPYPPFNGRVA